MGTFTRQFRALAWKNLLVFYQHPFLNLFRCFILPVVFGILLGALKSLGSGGQYGIGEPMLIVSLSSIHDGSLPLYWSSVPSNRTHANPALTPDAIVSHLSKGFDIAQLKGIINVNSSDDIGSACSQNFNGFSPCFAAVLFDSNPPDINFSEIPFPNKTVGYTIQVDSGLQNVDIRGRSGYERRIMPLQFALDSAITELDTGYALPTPSEWPFTLVTNEEIALQARLTYLNLVQSILVLPMFLSYVSIAYTLPGAFASERASLLTGHMKAMGLRDLPRILSWYLTHTMFYLPGWIVVAVVWKYWLFTGTHVLLILATNILLGLVLASHGLFIAVPFGKSPQLAAVVSTLVAIASAGIVLSIENLSRTSALVYSIFLPGGFFMYAIHCICSWELWQVPTNALKYDPGEIGSQQLLPFLIIAAVDVVLYLVLAVLFERFLYDAHEPRSGRSSRRKDSEITTAELLPTGTRISIRNLRKTYSAPIFRPSRGTVTAVSDLSLDIPSQGIFVLLGSNGAGKSTTLSILGNLLSRSSGDVLFSNGNRKHGRPQRGDIGIVPQKNVLFDDLTCLQNLHVWRAVKRPVMAGGPGDEQENLEQLLRDCDLGKKIHEKASTLSGGQKRKLQLAAGLVGGSSILLVDECTSGVDPLSRRAIWRILRSARENRTIILTTHFLDEADLLGDTIAVLASPGELVAQRTPVELKASIGSGYDVIVVFEPDCSATQLDRFAHTILDRMRTAAPSCEMTFGKEDGGVSYRLNSKDPRVVQAVLHSIDGVRQEVAIKDVDVQGTTMEAVFLKLMANSAFDVAVDTGPPATPLPSDIKKYSVDADVPILHARSSTASGPLASSHRLDLTSGRPQSFLRQMLTIFYKRTLITRRAWLTLLLTMMVVTIVSCVPLLFVRLDTSSCAKQFDMTFPVPLLLPFSDLGFDTSIEFNKTFKQDPGGPPLLTTSVLESRPGIVHTLGPDFSNVSTIAHSDGAAFTSDIRARFQNLSFGGVSFDFGSGNNVSQSSAMFAWEASGAGDPGLVALNLLDNILYNRALNASTPSGQPNLDPTFITANHDTFPYVQIGNLLAVEWAALFLAAMAVYPAFFSLYVCRERKPGVQAMQLSNGLSNPARMWLGHLIHDSIFSIVAATIVIIVFATTAAKQFHGLGLLWLVMVLYGIAATLFAYCMSLAVSSPLAAFAVTAGVQVLFMALYLVAYYLVHAYAKTGNAVQQLNVVHFTLSLLSPVGSISRASLLTVNLFLLLCDGDHLATGLGSITLFGGPIIYLIGQSLFYFGILMWRQSGAIFRPATSTIGATARGGEDGARARDDVLAEAERVASSGDALQVMKVTKWFGGGKTVVEDVSFSAQEGTTLALLGPNGAGKTTTFNMIRGDIIPTTGQILIQGKSVISQPRLARPALGVCPQFTAIDVLTVAEHLSVYGRLKGLRPGSELSSNVDQIILVAGLEEYRDRQASQLSGGNQRKLALAIALMGNPSVVLIDEFSSGVDAKMKREMWGTLKALSENKAVVITTHSMEEASALANKVAIVAKRMLAVGTVSELEARYATYEVHFSGRSYQDTLRAREVMARVPGAQASDDLATTRFQVPIISSASSPLGQGITLKDLFGILAEAEIEFAVERPTLEAVFLKIVREHNVEEDDDQPLKPTIWDKVKNLV